jgi:type VI protein secretion system component VasF
MNRAGKRRRHPALTTAALQALAALQTQAQLAYDLLLILQSQRDAKARAQARAARRQLRARLREAHVVMAQHRAECDEIIRIACTHGIPIPDLTPKMIATLGHAAPWMLQPPSASAGEVR